MPWRRTKQVLVAQSRGNLNETCWNVGILEHWARSEALALYWVKNQSDQEKPIHPLFHYSIIPIR
jgi:hypothetical protein